MVSPIAFTLWSLRAVALVFIPKGGNTCICKRKKKKEGRKKHNCVVVMLNEF